MKKNPLEGLESVFPGIAKAREPSAEMLEAVGVTAKPEPTPETDALVAAPWSTGTPPLRERYATMSQHARDLERRLAAANRRVAELEGYNVGLADEVRIVRGALDVLVDAIDRSSDMDEMDGPEYQEAQAKLDAAMAAARPHTEAAITQQAIAELEGGRDGE